MGKLADSAFPGIVDVVEQEEERFLIMEWIEGETLAVQMERDGRLCRRNGDRDRDLSGKSDSEASPDAATAFVFGLQAVKCDEGF